MKNLYILVSKWGRGHLSYKDRRCALGHIGFQNGLSDKELFSIQQTGLYDYIIDATQEKIEAVWRSNDRLLAEYLICNRISLGLLRNFKTALRAVGYNPVFLKSTGKNRIKNTPEMKQAEAVLA